MGMPASSGRRAVPDASNASPAESTTSQMIEKLSDFGKSSHLIEKFGMNSATSPAHAAWPSFDRRS